MEDRDCRLIRTLVLSIRLLPYWNWAIIAAGSVLFAGPFRHLGPIWGVVVLESMSLCVLLAYFQLHRAVLSLLAPRPQDFEPTQPDGPFPLIVAIVQGSSRQKRVFLVCLLTCWMPAVLAGNYGETLENAVPSLFVALFVTVWHLKMMQRFRIIAWYAERMTSQSNS